MLKQWERNAFLSSCSTVWAVQTIAACANRGKGAAKGQVIKLFAGDSRSIEDFNPFAKKAVLVDASGWGHRATKHGAEE
eukprot:6198422-Pleurochrysis_carterae.AAC.3